MPKKNPCSGGVWPDTDSDVSSFEWDETESDDMGLLVLSAGPSPEKKRKKGGSDTPDGNKARGDTAAGRSYLQDQACSCSES